LLFGDFLVSKKVLNPEQVKKILEVQLTMELRKRKLFGHIAVDLGFADKNKIEDLFLEYCKTD